MTDPHDIHPDDVNVMPVHKWPPVGPTSNVDELSASAWEHEQKEQQR